MLDSASSLADLWEVNVQAQRLSVRNNFALIAAATAAAAVRRRLGLSSHADVVTRAMMEEYAELACRPSFPARIRGLEGWLWKYGHRGPARDRPGAAEILRAPRHALPGPCPGRSRA